MASATNVHWEVVRKQPKKSKENPANNNKLTKTQVRDYLDKMPKLGEIVPLKESKTMFDAFREKPSPVEKKTAQQPGKQPTTAATKTKNGESHASNKEGNKQKKKNADKKKLQGKVPQSLEEAIQNLNVNELQTLMTMVQLRFPDSPNIWLKDLISYLNLKLNFDTRELCFKQKDYSLYVLPEDLQLIIKDTLKHCSDQVLYGTLEQAVSQMADDISKGMKIHGYQIILQAIIQKIPEISDNFLQKCVELCKTYQNRTPACLSIFWVIGQFGINDFETGFKVWVELFFPLLGIRTYSRYVVDYIQALLSWHFKGIPKENAVDVSDFFLFLDTLYSNSANLDVQLYNELLSIYPKLKVLSFGTDPHENLHTFFPSFLSRLKASCSRQLRSELLLSLVTCLKLDDECYIVWRQILATHVAQSSILLEHILKNYDNIIPNVSKKYLKETLSAFIAFSEEHSNKKSKNHQIVGLTEGQQTSEMLLLKIGKQSNFTWYGVIVVFIAILLGCGIYDWQSHGSFQNSQIGQLFQKCNLLLFKQWADSIGSQSYSFIQKVCQPYFLIFDRWMRFFTNVLLDGTGRLNMLIVDNLPTLLNWVDGWFPNVFIALGSGINDIWTLASHFISPIYQYMWNIIG